jgi:hypothetical protein
MRTGIRPKVAVVAIDLDHELRREVRRYRFPELRKGQGVSERVAAGSEAAPAAGRSCGSSQRQGARDHD